jgi:CHAT domain-containing protein/Tfp pilus assembly protein PilF
LSQFEQIILQLADTSKNPEEFTLKLERFNISPSEKGRLFLQAGNILYGHFNAAWALSCWTKGLTFATTSVDVEAISCCYQNLGKGYCHLSDFNKAIEYSNKALPMTKALGDKAGEAICYGTLGWAYDRLGDLWLSIKYHNKALKLVIELGDKIGQSNCYLDLGNVYFNSGDFRKAIEYFDMSLQMAKSIGNEITQATCYGNLGTTYDHLGDFRKAIEYIEKSLLMAKNLGDREGEGRCYGNLGAVYDHLGDFRKAIEYNEKSLPIQQETHNKYGEYKSYVNLGAAYRNLGDSLRSIVYTSEALKIAAEIGDKAGESACNNNLGTDCIEEGNFKRAIEHFEKALGIAEKIGNKALQADPYNNLGNAYRNLGDLNKAIQSYEKALDLVKGTNQIEKKRIGLLNLGVLYYESNPDKAYVYLEQSIALIENICGQLVEEYHKREFQAKASEAYQFMVPLCLKLGKEKEAFEYVEGSKSRAFLDLLAATEISPTVKLTKELKSLLNDEASCLADLRAIQMRHLKPYNSPVELGKVDSVLERLNQIYKRISEIDPEYVSARRAKPLSLTDIQNMLFSQKRDILLIEYFTTSKETFIFVVSSRNRELHVKTVPLSAERLHRYLDDYQREVANCAVFGDIGNAWLGLSEYLIAPASDFLTENDLVYFVPHGLLHYLPLHALELNGEPLIKSHPVAYAPSASSLKFCLGKGTGKLENCVSFGVDFEEEAEKVATLFNTTADNGSMATKDNVIRKCGNGVHDIIHFSCHGEFVSDEPLSSYIKLYNDQRLTAKEIFDFKLNTELVTLSACQTGINETSKGDDLIGLTRALLYAGAPSIIVSLWSVDAQSAQEFMIEFYTLLKSNIDKASALQEAQKKMMEKHPHPYYWAPFILVGKPS